MQETLRVYTPGMSDMALHTRSETYSLTATVEDDGETQIVRLPENVRLDGDKVEVRRVEGGLLLRPVAAPHKWTREEIDAFWARLDSYGADPIFPDGRDQGTFEVRDPIL